jgi:hypothetical protein
MTTLLQWPVTTQPLPRPVRPVLDETVTSYLHRLGEANCLAQDALRRRLQEHRTAPIQVGLLATLSGQRPQALRYAILELCTSQELASMHVTGRPRPGAISTFKCRLCTRSRQVTDWVRCWRRSEDVICHHHRRWTAGNNEEGLGLTRQPDILHANRQHQRLINRYGHRTVFNAFTQASEICNEWIERHRFTGHTDFQRRMRLFLGPGWQADFSQPAISAALYPQVVGLTRLLASPYWRPLAVRDQTGNNAFVAELRRTAHPDYTWNPNPYYRYFEPLVRLYRDEQDSAEYAYRYKTSQPIHTIESSELRQDNWDG